MSLSLAIVFPVVIGLVLLVVQASMWWYARQVALTAAREGVDSGRVQGRDLTDQQKNEAAKRQAEDFMRREGVDEVEDYSVSTAGSTAEVIRVSVRVTPHFLLPLLPHPEIEQHAQAPRERFVAPPGSGS
ncbi:TadE/TadG family type IV pilus assembly protein [Kitasatospora sp. NPDC004240]